MSPELRVRLTAKNETGRGFGQVVADARTAAGAVESSSTRAAGAAGRHGNALATMGKSAAMAANQQRNLVFQLNDVGVSLASGMNPLMVFAQQGSQIATIYGPDEGGLGRALKETGNLAVGLVTKFWPVAAVVGVGTAAIAGMTAEINKAGEQQVSFGDVAMATWQVFAEGVYSLVQPAITAIGGWFSDMWAVAWPVLKAAGNGIIATFVGAFDATVAVWSAFPQVMGDFVYSAVNTVVGGVETLINVSIGKVNEFKKLLGLEGDIGTISFGGVENPYDGAMRGVASDVVGAFQNAFGVDYLGEMFDAIGTRAQALAAASGEATAAAKPMAHALEAANDNAAKLGETLAGSLTQGVMGIWQAFRSGENVIEAISNSLMNFADQLMNSAISGFFSNLFGGVFGSIAGGAAIPSGGFIPGITGPRLFAKGGIANSPSIISEYGQPEAAVPLPDGRTIPVTLSGAADGNGGGYIDVSVTVGVENGQLVPLISKVSGVVAGQKIKQDSPAAVATAQRNRWMG